MREYQRYIFLLSAISGIAFVAHKISGIKFTFHINSDDLLDDRRDNEEEYLTKIFDCPECGMPAEVAGMALDLQEDGSAFPCYIVNCFGEHSTIAVTTEWLLENASEKG